MELKHYIGVKHWDILECDAVSFLTKAFREGKEKGNDKGTGDGMREFLLNGKEKSYSYKDVAHLDMNILEFLCTLARASRLNIIKAKEEKGKVQRYHLVF